MHIKKINIGFVAPLLLAIIAVLYVFITYSPWLTSQCIAPLGADIKFHMATANSFVEQIKEYGIIYPIEYSEDISGFYWYIRGIIPLLVPALLHLFFPFNTAFFLGYLLVYIFVVLALYFFVRKLTDHYIGFVCAIFFLFSNIANMAFSVGGNYPFFFGLFFFFLSMLSFYKYAYEPTKKHFLYLFLSALSLGMTYIISFIFFISFVLLYMLVIKQWKIFKIFLILILSLSLFLIPSFFTGTQLSTSVRQFDAPVQFLRLFILPSTPFSWIYQSQTVYQGPLDFNQGIHLYLFGLLGAAYLVYRRFFTKSSTFLLGYMALIILWVFLGFFSRIIPLQFFQSFFGTVLPIERLVTHVALSFLFIGCYALHRLSLDWETFVPVTFLSLLVLGTKIFSTKFFYALVGVAVLYGLKELLSKKKKIHHHHLILGSLLLLLLLFPLTGKVETTNLEPRVSFFTVDDSKLSLARDDVFYFVGGWSLEQAILACTPTHSIIQQDRDGAISGLSSDINVFDSSERTKEILQRRGVTKLLIVLDQIVEDGKINEQKVAHLIQWFGQPTVMQPGMNTIDKKQNYYPIFVFTIPRIPRDYGLKMVNPRVVEITNSQHKDTFLVNIEYHPWWKAIDSSTREPLQIENDGGLMRLNNIGAVDTITLVFSLKYFIVGLFLSLCGIGWLVRELRQRHIAS